jgi:hypothetical protein
MCGDNWINTLVHLIVSSFIYMILLKKLIIRDEDMLRM